MSAFVIMLREGMEAAVIIAILLGSLDRLGRRRDARWVWVGTAGAVAVSMGTGLVLWNTVGALDGSAEQLVEGSIAFASVGLLAWMVFWMARHGRHVRDRLSSGVDAAVAGGAAATLAILAFVAIVREGVEASLFLISTTVGERSSGSVPSFGLAGLVVAIAIGVAVYTGGARIDLRTFFRVTGVIIILFSAGLLSRGVHEFQELGLLPVRVEHVWNTTVLDPSTGVWGQLPAGLFGWSPRPSLLMVAAWVLYAVPVLATFWARTAASVQSASDSPSSASEPESASDASDASAVSESSVR